MQSQVGPLQTTPLIIAVKRVILTIHPRIVSFTTKHHRTGVRSSLKLCERDGVARGMIRRFATDRKTSSKNINRAKIMFVKTSIVAAAFAGFVVTGFAGVIVDEPFNYAPDRILAARVDGST
jgi:hypothetical protein